jgi:Tol biopolymer transport system component
MPSIDDQLRDRLRGSAPRPFEGDDLVARLNDRKHRRETTRKLGTVALVACVLLATAGTFLALSRAFRAGPTPAGPTPVSANGSIVVSIPNEGSYHLMILPPDQQDLDPSDGVTTAGLDSMQKLTWVGGTQDTEPAVSPDGSTVAFVRKDGTDVPPSLWLIDIDGTHERQVTRAPADVKSPAWSPDGSTILFSAADEPEGRALYTIHPDGSDLQMLVRGQDVEGVAWSPDGRSVVYSAADPTIADGSFDVWDVSLDGSAPNDLTPTAAVDETDPSWSPDGTTIAFATPDGIEEILAGGGASRVVVPPSTDGRVPTQPAWSPDGAYLTFVKADCLGSHCSEASPSPPLVYVVPDGETDTFPMASGSSFAWQPVPVTSPTPSVENLGFPFPICRVMSMPITISGVARTAYVVSKASGGCPAPGEGHRFAGVDVDGDGVIDANVELHGCYPPVGCEAFAAPDVNGDGTSEIATSEAGADGYGISLYEVIPPASWSPLPMILPLDVVDPNDIGNLQTGPLQFAWVDVAGHTEGAHCDVTPSGTTFTIYGYDKMGAETDVRTTTLSIEPTSATATVTDDSSERMPVDQAPVPKNELCGAPLQGSAANFPNAAGTNQMDIGIGEPLCDVSKLVADFTGDGKEDTVFVGEEGRDGRCTGADEGTEVVAMDVTGDGRRDGGYLVSVDCLLCAAYAATDLDGNGMPELIVLHQSSATPVYELIEPVMGSAPGSLRLEPILITSDAPQMGLSAGQPLTLTAGGDEGSSFAIGCEGSPAGPVLIQWRSQHPVDGPGSDVRDVYETKLTFAGTNATVVDAQHTTQPTSDPLPFDSLNSSGCGVQWFPLQAN